MRMIGKLGTSLLLASLVWAAALQAAAGGADGAGGAGPAGIGAGAEAPAQPAAAVAAATGRDQAKATIVDLMDDICRKRRASQYNVCAEHCEAQGMWGWYDDPGHTCGYGARCTCVYYAEASPGK